MVVSLYGIWDVNFDRFYLVVEDVYGVVGSWSVNGEFFVNDVMRYGIYNGGFSRIVVVLVDIMRCLEVSEVRYGG